MLAQTANAFIDQYSLTASKQTVKKGEQSKLTASGRFAFILLDPYPQSGKEKFTLEIDVAILEKDSFGDDWVWGCKETRTVTYDQISRGIGISCSKAIVPSKYSEDPFEGKETEYQSTIKVTHFPVRDPNDKRTESVTTNRVIINCLNC